MILICGNNLRLTLIIMINLIPRINRTFIIIQVILCFLENEFIIKNNNKFTSLQIIYFNNFICLSDCFFSTKYHFSFYYIFTFNCIISIKPKIYLIIIIIEIESINRKSSGNSIIQ